MYKIVTPVSHLFFNKKNAKKIIQNSDYLEIRYKTLNLEFNNEKFFHCDEDITLPWSKNFKDKFEKILKIKKNLKYVSFQSTRCCSEEKLLNNFFILSGKKFNKKQMLEEARKNKSWLTQKFGNKLKFGLENNNYYPSKAYDIVTNADFISEVVLDNKLFFLFDLAHAKITASNQNINYSKYLDKLPMEMMIQIHICRPKINTNKISCDTHYLPNKNTFEEIKKMLKKYKSLKFFTIEYYKNTEKLIRSIKLLKKIIN